MRVDLTISDRQAAITGTRSEAPSSRPDRPAGRGSGPSAGTTTGVEILAKAMTLRPPAYDIFIVPHRHAPAGVGATREVDPAPNPERAAESESRARLIAIARATSPELASWLAEAINCVLDQQSPGSPPGGARFVDRGSFGTDRSGLSVVAWGYSMPRLKQRIGTEIACCSGHETAAELAARLNALLRP